MLADQHVGSKRDMPIHRLLNEDAVALVIASIPTGPALSTNDSRPLFIQMNEGWTAGNLESSFVRMLTLI